MPYIRGAHILHLMKTIEYNAQDGDLSIQITYQGLVAASYVYSLWDAQSNTRLQKQIGNNQNPQDDHYELPTPAADNDGRLIQLRSEFVGLDKDSFGDYGIKLELMQGGNAIGEASQAGKLTGEGQTSLIFVQLKANS